MERKGNYCYLASVAEGEDFAQGEIKDVYGS